MKFVQAISTEMPILGIRNELTSTPVNAWHHVVLLETDASFYQVVEFGNGSKELVKTPIAAKFYADFGRRVTVKRAVELFGSGISEKMDWSDPE